MDLTIHGRTRTVDLTIYGYTRDVFNDLNGLNDLWAYLWPVLTIVYIFQ